MERPNATNHQQKISGQASFDTPLFPTPDLTSTQKPSSLNIRDLLITLFKHKYQIFMVLMIGVISGPLVYKLTPKLYQAKSLIMFRYGREYVRPNLGQEEGPIRVGLNEVLNTEISILGSRDLKERVIKSVGIQNMYPNMESIPEPSSPVSPVEFAILSLEKNLSMEIVKNANLIRVSLQGENPRIAAQIVNQLVDSYKEKRMEILNDSRSTLFLEKKVDEYWSKLKESEQKFNEFKQNISVFSFDENRSAIFQQKLALESSLKSTQVSRKELQTKLAAYESQLKTISETIPLEMDNDALGALGQGELQLMNLKQKEEELLSKYKPDNGFIISIRNEIRMVENFLENQKKKRSGKQRMATNDLYRNVQKEVMTTKADLDSIEVRDVELQRQLQEMDKSIQALNRQEKDVRDMQREQVLNEQNYQTYLKKLEEARISDDLDQLRMTSVDVVERAVAPTVPIKPEKPLMVYVLLGLFLGAAAAVGLAFFREAMAQGMSTPQQAEKRLKIPILATMPYKP